MNQDEWDREDSEARTQDTGEDVVEQHIDLSVMICGANSCSLEANADFPRIQQGHDFIY